MNSFSATALDPPAQEIVLFTNRIPFLSILLQAPLNHFVVSLQAEGALSHGNGKDWRLVAAPQTYNPLGTTVTFLSPEDIVEAARPMLGV